MQAGACEAHVQVAGACAHVWLGAGACTSLPSKHQVSIHGQAGVPRWNCPWSSNNRQQGQGPGLQQKRPSCRLTMASPGSTPSLHVRLCTEPPRGSSSAVTAATRPDLVPLSQPPCPSLPATASSSPTSWPTTCTSELPAAPSVELRLLIQPRATGSLMFRVRRVSASVMYCPSVLTAYLPPRPRRKEGRDCVDHAGDRPVLCALCFVPVHTCAEPHAYANLGRSAHLPAHAACALTSGTTPSASLCVILCTGPSAMHVSGSGASKRWA